VLVTFAEQYVEPIMLVEGHIGVEEHEVRHVASASEVHGLMPEVIALEA